MYILSRDRFNMDLDRASQDLMIQLLKLEQHASSAKLLNEKDMNKIKEKIWRLCETVHNKHLDLENITVSSSLPSTGDCHRGCVAWEKSFSLLALVYSLAGFSEVHRVLPSPHLSPGSLYL